MDEIIFESEQILEEDVLSSEEDIFYDSETEVVSEIETESDIVEVNNEDLETIVSYINSVSGNNVPESDSVNYDELIYSYLTENSVLNPTPVIEENFFYKDFSDYDSTQIIGVSTLFIMLIFMIIYIIKE